MPVSADIYNAQIVPPPPESPLTSMAKVAALRSGIEEQQLRAQQYRDALDEKRLVAQAWSQANGDPQKAIQLVGRVNPQLGMKLGGELATYQKQQSEMQERQAVQKAWQDSGGDPLKAIQGVRAAGFGDLASQMEQHYYTAQKAKFEAENAPKEFGLREMTAESAVQARRDAAEDRDLTRQALEQERMRQERNRAEDNLRQDRALNLTEQYRKEQLKLGRDRLAAQGGAGAVPLTMPPEYQNALARTLLAVPATRRGFIQQSAESLWKQGNPEALKDFIMASAIEGENVDTKNQVRGRRAVLNAMEDVRSMLGELKAAGVDTGILRGTAENVAASLGKSTNPKLRELATRLQDTVIQYRRAATGVQFGEREGAEYQKMFPNYSNDLPVNIATLDGLERAVRTNDRSFWEGKLGVDGAKLVGAVKTPPPPGGGGQKLQKEIPGYPGTLAESTDGGKTWKRIK